jgi:ketosteroid isomerase-like protein
MSRFLPLGYASALVSPCVLACAAGEDPGAAKAAIRTLEEQVAHSPTMDVMSSFYAPDVETFFMTPGHFRGFVAAAKDSARLWGGTMNWRVNILEMTVDVEGNMAVAYSIQRWTGDSRATNQPAFDVTFRQIDVWRKLKGKWLISYQNVSVPVDFRSGTAICSSGSTKCEVPPFPKG